MDKLPNVFGRLPKPLQIEIYEFARGDRNFFKAQFKKVVDHLEVRIERSERHIGSISKVKVMLKNDANFWVSPHHHRFMKYLQTTPHPLYADTYYEYNEKLKVWWTWRGYPNH